MRGLFVRSGLVRCGRSSGSRIIENLCAFAQRTFEQEFTIRIDDIENHVSDRYFAHELGADFLSAQALLQRAEREGSAGVELLSDGRDDFRVSRRRSHRPGLRLWRVRPGQVEFRETIR